MESHVLPATSAGSLNRWPGFSPAGYSGVFVNNWFGGKWCVSVTTGSLCLLSAGVIVTDLDTKCFRYIYSNKSSAFVIIAYLLLYRITCYG